jgi:hypothetical protein
MIKEEVNYTLDTRNIWFPDQREPRKENKREFRDYWRREIDRCMQGFLLGNQVYISGWLYFHTVYWMIELDHEIINPITGKKDSFKVKGVPVLRDIEWMVADDIERAEREKKMYFLNSARGIGKSFIASSIIGQIYTFVPDSESLITGGNNPDIAKLAEKIDMGLTNIHPVFQKKRIKNNWKVEVRSGYVDKSSGFTKGSNSRVLTRNYDDGNNTMATNGTRPKRQIIDETGKIPNLIKCVLDSMPSWMNDYGFFSLPCMFGTGGDQERGKDAGVMFNNPELYNILAFDDEWEGKGKIARFIPVTQGRNEYKDDWTLYDYLRTKYPKYANLEPHSELDIIIKVSNEQKCMDEYVNPRRAKAKKSTSSNEIIKEKAYYPITPSECFLTISANDFPVEACKDHRDWISKEGFRAINVELYTTPDGVITHKMTDKMPVTDYPVKTDTDKRGCIQVVEFPISNPPYGLYVMGIDPYKIGESEWSDSLGSAYVLKRMTTDMTDPYQYMPVCWYTARPKSIDEWNENVRMMIKWYNASAMCENNDYGFIQYMLNRNEEMYMAKGQSFLKEISPNSKHKSEYGLPATTQMIDHWNKTLVKYTSEELVKERDEVGNPVPGKTILGVKRILDPMILEEMVKFNKTEGNYDRIRALSIAVAYARQLDAILPPTELDRAPEKKEKRTVSPFNTYKSTSTFSPTRSPFRTKL